ncbi:MAG TPA: molybdopterin-dependent oxidoreductase [Anaerolineales bacterium]|nr:molybdopterin-dependent oxidoreductase [Anaerolineales bacterium]
MNGKNLRIINTLILILTLILGVTGIYGLVWPFPTIIFDLHRIAGWAFILLIPWKTIIAIRSLRRGMDKRFDRNVMIIVSVISAIAVLVALILAIAWKWNLGDYYVWIAGYGYSGIGWHWGITLYVLPLLVLHIWRRWHRPRKTDFLGRRQALQLIGLGIASLVGWRVAEALSGERQSPGSPRRFTGSREAGSFSGLAYPVTTGPGQGQIRLDPSTWKLKIGGAVEHPFTLNYDEALALSTSKMIATLDCTGGWYTTQIWQGIRLIDLLKEAGVREERIVIALRDVSGYTAHITPAEIADVLLAMKVGGQILDHQHGYPMRAVVPSRRGWHWVKWLMEIEISNPSNSLIF